MKIKAQNHNYQVKIKSGLISQIKLRDNCIVITDQNVKKYYGKYFKKYSVLTIRAGEKSKRFQTIENLAEKLLALGADRNTTLIALGGGVVGDITGFLASIYMRGIEFIQIPTTLLAMVDASVGGKTGVDLKSGKNLLGSFHQPRAVYIDPAVLKILPKKEYLNGLAEVIKHGIINGRFFKWLEQNKKSIKQMDLKVLEQMITKNVIIKKAIVEQDEKENGQRAILNLGHTFGHAIESLSNYKISHGEAVAKGIIKAAELSNLKTIKNVKELFKFFSIKYLWPESNKFTAKDVVNNMKVDKKTKDKSITLILPVKLGKVKIYKNYDEKEILKVL
ncbi:MAG: 3-dehydroquinate synthase [Patescibacteria group bacterium]